MDLLSKVKQNANIAFRVIGDEALIVNPKDGLIYPLNPTATRVWQLLDGQKNCGEIIEAIDAEFEGEKVSLGQDVLDFIESLLKENLAVCC
ncbi:MAG: PqqD family protein [Candidatus Omnitrophica bacterium]|nr:PqqD family protein [Candidatus Omnitrophota bacterium]